MAHKEPLPAPPWPTKAKVIYASDMFYSLKMPGAAGVEAQVDWDGGWWCSFDSRSDIKGHMTLDKKLTKRIQADFEDEETGYRSGGWHEWIRDWLRQGVPAKLAPKDWFPASSKKVPFGRVFRPSGGGLGSDNTTNSDAAYWWGDTFEYTHFLTDDDEEGAIIMWHHGGDVRGNYRLPEVWMGDFGSFMSMQEEQDSESAETFLRWNETFENMILWSLDELGLFEGKVNFVGNPREPVSHEPTRQIVDAIDQDPRILYPSLVEKILGHQDILPKKLVRVAGKVVDLERRRAEEEAGQGRFWAPPDIVP